MDSSANSAFIFIAIIGLIALASLIITIIAVVDIVKSDFKGDNDKLVWLLLTLLVSPFGAILYFIIGTKQKKLHSSS